MKFDFKLERGEWIHISPLYYDGKTLNAIKPKEFKARAAWNADYKKRVRAYKDELRSLGLKNEAANNKEAEELYAKLKPIADKYDLMLEAGRACAMF